MGLHDNDQVFNDNDLNFDGTSDLSNSVSVHEEDGTNNPNFVTEEKVVENKVEAKTETKVETPSTDSTKKEIKIDRDADETAVAEDKKETEETVEAPASEESNEVDYDAEGNLVNSKGEIIAAKDTFTVDDDGNVTLNEEVIEKEINTSVHEQIKSDYGFELTDEEGAPLDFNLNTPKGFSKAAGIVGEKLNEKYVKEMWKELPDVHSYFQHKVAGGSDAEFFNSETNFKQITIPEDSDTNKESNKRLRRDIIVQKFMMQQSTEGMDSEATAALQQEAENWADYQFAQGTETDKANSDLAWLHKFEDTQAAERDAYNKQVIANRKAENVKYWKGVKEVVDGGELEGITIPQSERENFYKYIALPANDKGQSQSQIDASDKGHKANLVLQYLRFKNFDLDKFIDTRAATKNAKKLRLVGQKSNQKNLNKGSGLKVKKTSNNTDGISLQNLSRNKK